MVQYACAGFGWSCVGRIYDSAEWADGVEDCGSTLHHLGHRLIICRGERKTLLNIEGRGYLTCVVKLSSRCV